MRKNARPSRAVLFVAAAAALAVALFLASQFPAVEGLGAKVRLPVFHGALTWANLVAFSLMALSAVGFLAWGREGVYRYETGLRWVSVSAWFVGSALGLWAALGTWDLSGSSSSPVTVVLSDPRLMAQFWTLLLGVLLLTLPLFVERARAVAVGDLAFTAVMWTLLLRAILGPGRALHPDSPVLNSPEIKIKLLFFGIFACLLAATLLASWGASTFARPRRAAPSEEAAA
jgi:hypothetical protein